MDDEFEDSKITVNEVRDLVFKWPPLPIGSDLKQIRGDGLLLCVWARSRRRYNH